MQIIFIGQLGLTEPRVSALAEKLVAAGHTVAVAGTAPAISRRLRNYKGIKLLYYPSFDPTRPGGLFYVLLSLVSIWRRQPDVVHLHGYVAASLVWLAALFSPLTTFVWTIDRLPQTWLERFSLRLGAAVCDALTTPTRTLQYHLRTRFGRLSTYIPDGFDPIAFPEINLKHFDLRKGQYCLVAPASDSELRWLIRAYSQVNTKKPLVALYEETPSARRLQKRYPLLRLVPPQGSRTTQTLARHAAVVIAGQRTPLTLLLSAMHAQRAIVAASTALNQETLGTTAPFFTTTASFRTILPPLTKSRLNQSHWGRLAAHRAATLFTWEHLLPEYVRLYRAPALQPVQIDSVVATLSSKVEAV